MPVPTFSWICPTKLKFTGDENELDATSLPGADGLSNLKEFTMATQVKLLPGPVPNDFTIFSHSSCGCWELALSTTGEIIFGERCNDGMVRTGFNMPIDKEVTMAVTYDGSTLNFYVDGGLVKS